MSKIISEENPKITTAQLQQKLKCMEAGHATAKYMKGAEGPEQKPINQICGKKGKMQFHQKRQGPHKDPKQGQKQGQQLYRKGKQPFHKGPTLSAKKLVKAQSNWKPIDPNTCMKCGDTHFRQGFPCPASHFQCKNCNRIGHFTSRCLTKSKTINQINFLEEINSLNAWQAQDYADTFYICQVQGQQQVQQQNTQRVSKYLYVNLPLTARHHHKNRLTFMLILT